MKVTIKAGDISITVEHEGQEPNPKEQWYSINMQSFTNSVINCIKQAAEQIVTLQKELYVHRKEEIASKVAADRFDAEDWLGKNKDIWNHPRITDRNNKESYEVSDLMAEFANWYYGNGNFR
jgi:hypothetical protein